MKEVRDSSLERVKSLYEALGAIQTELTDLTEFGERNDWREDWRGWKEEAECDCTRCSKFHQKEPADE